MLANNLFKQRLGVSLVVIAHGTNINSLLKNPELVPLLGGTQKVILSDKDRRGNKYWWRNGMIMIYSNYILYTIILEQITEYKSANKRHYKKTVTGWNTENTQVQIENITWH